MYLEGAAGFQAAIHAHLFAVISLTRYPRITPFPRIIQLRRLLCILAGMFSSLIWGEGLLRGSTFRTMSSTSSPPAVSYINDCSLRESRNERRAAARGVDRTGDCPGEGVMSAAIPPSAQGRCHASL